MGHPPSLLSYVRYQVMVGINDSRQRPRELLVRAKYPSQIAWQIRANLVIRLIRAPLAQGTQPLLALSKLPMSHARLPSKLP